MAATPSWTLVDIRRRRNGRHIAKAVGGTLATVKRQWHATAAGHNVFCLI